MKSNSSVHLTMNVVVGTRIRVDAVISINTGQGANRHTLSETASNEDGMTDNGFDAGLAVVTTTKRLLHRVSDELRQRGLMFTAKEIEDAFREDLESENSVQAQLHAVIDFCQEIRLHFWTETNGKTQQLVAASSNRRPS